MTPQSETLTPTTTTTTTKRKVTMSDEVKEDAANRVLSFNGDHSGIPTAATTAAATSEGNGGVYCGEIGAGNGSSTGAAPVVVVGKIGGNDGGGGGGEGMRGQSNKGVEFLEEGIIEETKKRQQDGDAMVEVSCRLNMRW